MMIETKVPHPAIMMCAVGVPSWCAGDFFFHFLKSIIQVQLFEHRFFRKVRFNNFFIKNFMKICRQMGGHMGVQRAHWKRIWKIRSNCWQVLQRCRSWQRWVSFSSSLCVSCVLLAVANVYVSLLLQLK